jgi:hypothetical protein
VFLSGKTPGLFVVDCSNPTSPTLLASADVPTGPMSIPGARAYVAAGEEGLQILDVSNPKTIRKIGVFKTDHPAVDLAVAGTTVYLLTGEKPDLLVIDAANPAKPVLVGRASGIFDDYTHELQVKKLGNAIYVIWLDRSSSGSSHDASCKVLDVSNPARLEPLDVSLVESPLGNWPRTGAVAMSDRGVATPGKDCYLCLPSYFYREGSWDVAFGGDMSIFDLSNPLRPEKVFYSRDMRSKGHAALYKNTLYLADGPGGLVIMQPVKKTGH